MDINKLLPILASQPPAQRVQLAAQLGLNAQALQQLETIAERNGLPLRGGRCVAAEGGADGGDLDGEEDESGAPTEGTLTLSTVLDVVKGRVVGYGGLALFFLGIPFVAFLIKERRGLSWAQLGQLALRLPYSD